MKPRKPYSTDISDEEWAFAAPYLTLMDVQAPQRKYELRAIHRSALNIARSSYLRCGACTSISVK